MLTVISCCQARRRLRRLLALVEQGHIVVITKNGVAMCKLIGVEAGKESA
ncbi:type II toxin-antitoxin system prevent-host-death family antitoxin [Pseudomonas sp. LB3P81]